MGHVKALIIKFIMVTAVLWLILGIFYNAAFADILIISLFLTGIAYLIGDLFLLPRIENWGATFTDFGLAFAGTWLLGSFLFGGNITLGSAALISALIIAAGEYFFHIYMENNVLDRELDRSDGKNAPISQYQTEYSKELDDDIERDKKE